MEPAVADLNTVAGLLIDGARRRGDREFILFEDGTRWSRQDALDVGRTAAAVMHARGVRPGDRVAIMLPNGADWLRAWWGAALLGAVIVPFNPTFVGRILEDMFELVQASFVIAEESVPEARDAAQLIIPAMLSVLGEAMPDLPVVKADDPHCIIFTSGTTGRSKGSLTSNFHVTNQSAWLREEGTLTQDDRFLADLPLFHVAALGNLASMMRIGGSVALRARPSLSSYWEVAREAGTTYGVLVSSMATTLMQRPPSATDRDHSMRFFLSSPQPAERERFVERFGLEGLCTAFGSTETGTAIRKPLLVDNPAGSCGLQRPGYELRIVDDQFNDVPDGVRGELWVRSARRAQMSLCYYNNPQATAEAWPDGWFRTGDMFERDADGFYYWRDRLKDSIRRRGENVSSQEVEREINQFPGIVESACVAVTGAFEGDEEIKAFVVSGPPIDFAALTAYLDGRLPHFMIPRFFEPIDALPKTPTMRVQKFALKAREAGPEQWDREAHGIKLSRKRPAGAAA